MRFNREFGIVVISAIGVFVSGVSSKAANLEFGPGANGYELGADSLAQEGVPKGELIGPLLFQSEIIQNTIRRLTNLGWADLVLQRHLQVQCSTLSGSLGSRFVPRMFPFAAVVRPLLFALNQNQHFENNNKGIERRFVRRPRHINCKETCRISQSVIPYVHFHA